MVPPFLVFPQALPLDVEVGSRYAETHETWPVSGAFYVLLRGQISLREGKSASYANGRQKTSQPPNKLAAHPSRFPL